MNAYFILKFKKENFGFFTGDTGTHLLEINDRGRFIRFLNDTNHINDLVEVAK